MTEAGELQVDYWRGFADYLEGRQTGFRARTPRPRHYMSLALGRSGVQYNAYMNTQDHRVGVALYIKGDDAAHVFAYLREQRQEIQQTMGFEADWEEKPGRKHSTVIVRLDADTTNPEVWPELYRWTLDKLEAFDRAFGERVRALPRPFVYEESDAEQKRDVGPNGEGAGGGSSRLGSSERV